MPFRTKMLILLLTLIAIIATVWSALDSSKHWLHFAVFLTAILLTSGMKVILPQGEGSMSLNFPLLLLAILQLSPLQTLLLAALSVAVQCRIRVAKIFTAVQILFNIANSVVSTMGAFLAFALLTRCGMAPAPALSLAAVAYFLFNTIPVALAISWGKGEQPFSLWKAEFPWYLPFYLVGALLAVLADQIAARYGSATSLLMLPAVYTVYRAYTAQIVRAKERQQHLEETEALHLRTIEGLAMAIEAKDQETHDHLFRVRNYVEIVGKALHLSKVEMNALHTAALLHDIGKLAVPEHIINKPGRLTPEEFERMKIHPAVGADILERVKFPYPVVPIVRSHHEWWNGKGYPDGLKGDEIPIGARILTVVDCFDALTSDRPYRKGKSLDDAMTLVRSLSGTQFDPEVVDVFQVHCLELERQIHRGVEKEFIPLKTEMAVWRGEAPGAGFEAQNSDSEQSGEISGSHHDRTPSEAVTASLNLIAAASQEAQTLFEMSQSLGNSLSLQETISVMASRLHRLVPFECCALYLKVDNAVVLQHVDGEGTKCFSAQPIPMGEGISGWVAQSGKAILNGNASVEPSYHERGSQNESLRAALAMPLFDLKKEIFGVLTLYATKVDSFSRDHLRIMQVMESKLSMSLQNAFRFNRAESNADTDFLTGLPNARRLFLQVETELDRCRRSGEVLSIVMCDLNSFKEVNDQEGHLAGNMLLSCIGDHFRCGCRPYDTVARIGGDEFVFLFPGMHADESAERLHNISSMVESACAAVRIETKVSASLGACSFPEDGETAEELLAAADRRMYLHKQAHHGALVGARAEGRAKANSR